MLHTRALSRREGSLLGRELIVVFRPGALGDTLVTVPALRAIRAEHPNAVIELVGNGPAGRFLAVEGIVDSALDFDDAQVLPLFYSPPQIPSRWADTSLVVVWLDNADALAYAFKELGAAVLACSPMPAEPKLHVAEHLLRSLADVGVGSGELRDLVGAINPEKLEPRRRVVIHPGSGSATKNWPAANYAALVRELGATGAEALLMEGPADRDVLLAVQGALAPQSVRVVRPPSLDALAAELRAARLYVGNDSGVTHLAGLLGAPIVAIFGATDPKQWAPLGPKVRVVQGAALALGQRNRWPSVEEVRRTATDWLG
jgi:heptosyltransferase III